MKAAFRWSVRRTFHAGRSCRKILGGTATSVGWRRSTIGWFAVCAVCLASSSAVFAEDAPAFQYQQGRFEKGELQLRNGLPVLTMAGTAAEIGRQEAALTTQAAIGLVSYPRDMAKRFGREDIWVRLMAISQSLVPQFPAEYLAELDAFAAKSGVNRDLLLGANTMVDSYRGSFGCSSVMVEPQRSATGGPLFGRNLDFFTQGTLQLYSLVKVYRPQGKRAFVSIGFPGMLGCLSGMNDAGLALAVHEVFVSRDGSPMFNPKGVPYTLIFRRIMEECSTIAEAEKLLRSVERTTLLSLALCDRTTCAVAELTPRSVEMRGPEDGVCACANHFRTEALATIRLSPRYRTLTRIKESPVIGTADIAKKLHEVNAGPRTLQTMVFEPAVLRLHLAIGSCPSSALPLKELDLAPLFGVPQPTPPKPTTPKPATPPSPAPPTAPASPTTPPLAPASR